MASGGIQIPQGNPTIEGEFKRCISPGLNRPHDVIYHGGSYVVTDTFYRRVVSVNPVDASSEVLCQKKDGLQKTASNMKPYGIVSLSATCQDFLFTDMKNKCVLRFKEGVCTRWIDDDSAEMGCPTGIAVDQEGMVYVADAEKKCVHVFDASGKHVRVFGAEVLEYPWFMKFNSEGALFVADHDKGVLVFKASGELLYTLSVRSENRSWSCRGVAIDKYDNVFVTARAKGSVGVLSREQVAIFDRNLTPVANIGGVCQFRFARGLCFDYDRNLLVVVDGEAHRLQLYKLYDQPPPSMMKLVEEMVRQELEATRETTKRLDNPGSTKSFAEDTESGIAGKLDHLNFSLPDEIDDDDYDVLSTPKTESEDEYDYDDSDLTLLEEPSEEYYHIASAGEKTTKGATKPENSDNQDNLPVQTGNSP